jgi:transcriptional regulator with XRE-family HTH domain
MAHAATAQGFRDRLEQVIARTGLNHAAFSRHVGVDRSTLSQLISPANDRLPRAETLMAIATHCRVSMDWLLGLSQREEVGAPMVETALTIETQAHAPFDHRFLRWLAEADGRKLRTVPVSFPDFMKIDAVMAFEYAVALEADPQPDLAARRRQIEDALDKGTEIEACVALQALDAFTHGQGAWAGIDADVRREQLAEMIGFVDSFYPAFRLFLYDLRQTYSAPFTVFGQSRVAVYLGPSYMMLNASEHIRMFARRFDDIIRTSAVQPHEAVRHLEALRTAVSAA